LGKLTLWLELYGTFVIEQRHGFNKTTARLFIVDKVKTFLISAAIGGPLLSLIIFIVRFFGETFVFYLLVFIIVAQFGLFLLLGDTIMKLDLFVFIIIFFFGSFALTFYLSCKVFQHL
jgi:STE24 endopeptidase